MICTVSTWSSMVKNYDTWNTLDSDWLETRYARCLSPEPEAHCLSKCLVIKSHYDEVIMMSFCQARKYGVRQESINLQSPSAGN